ncbi:MAG: hypothetical protein JSW61_13465 [Candidatus Thorarchaeota archaeon]|nr:MAG: hypothetical protein JSW61_13465 [Candidatus Thorarchaeota archaeon]
MFEFVIGELAPLDIFMALMTGVVGGVVLAAAFRWTQKGVEHWKPRKLVHVVMGTLVAFTVVTYSNISGPSFAAGIFLTVLVYAWAHKSDLIEELLLAGSREGESNLSTFASGFMGLIAFAAAFIVFFQRPEIFVSAMLAVSWADAAGEIVGRPYGGRLFRRPKANKSLEGALSVFLVSLLAFGVSLAVFSVDTCPLCVVPELLLVALVVTIIEFFSVGWTDNFFIPLATAVLLWLLVFPTMPLLVF